MSLRCDSAVQRPDVAGVLLGKLRRRRPVKETRPDCQLSRVPGVEELTPLGLPQSNTGGRSRSLGSAEPGASKCTPKKPLAVITRSCFGVLEGEARQQQGEQEVDTAAGTYSRSLP